MGNSQQSDLSGFPQPPVAADLSVREFDSMLLDVNRLRDADIVGRLTGDEFKAAVLLWCAAWHQIPAGSLPDDDRLLAHFAGLGGNLRRWKSLKEGALYGFQKHSDARLYHIMIVRKACELDARRLRNTDRTKAATMARRKKNQTKSTKVDERNDAHSRQRDVGKVKEREDITLAKANAAPSAAPLEGEIEQPVYVDAQHELWGYGFSALVDLGVPAKSARPNIGKWLKDARNDAVVVLDAIKAARAARVMDPIPWIFRAIQSRMKSVGARREDSSKHGMAAFVLDLHDAGKVGSR